MTDDPSRPLPREVPGYDRARSLGLTPQVPTQPPSLLPGSTAHAAFWGWLRTLGLLAAGWLVVMVVLGRLGGGTAVVAVRLLLLGVGLLGFYLLFVRGRARVGRRVEEELTAGYTTLQLQFGGFGVTRQRSRPRHTYREPWDHAGTWVLDPSGRPLREPDRTVDPPGFYPSPNRPGELELWTGSAWGSSWRRPATPFSA